jgi:hypothetical protein
MMFILEEPYFAGNQTFLNESNEIVTEPVYKNDILNKLIVTGVPKWCFSTNDKCTYILHKIVYKKK